MRVGGALGGTYRTYGIYGSRGRGGRVGFGGQGKWLTPDRFRFGGGSGSGQVGMVVAVEVVEADLLMLEVHLN